MSNRMHFTLIASQTPTPSLRPTPSDPLGPSGPLVTYFQDPGAAVHHLLTCLRHWALGPGVVAGPVLLVGLVAVWVARVWWRRRCQRQLAVDARLISILAPPTVDPAGAQALWANLVGLLRPAWRRRVTGQPHVAFEYAFTTDGVQLRLWVPGLVPPGMVERAIEAAWPSTHTSTQPATAPADAVLDSDSRVEVGGELRLARSEALPIRTDFTADPIRALLGAPVGLNVDEQVTVQVLGRPVTGRRVTHARRAARQLHTGRSPRLAGRILDLATPHPPSRRTDPGARAALDRVTSLEHTAQDRAVVAKTRGPLFETRIRYAVTAPTPIGVTRSELAEVRDRLRGRGHAIASAFAAYGEHNHYRRHRLPHPSNTIESRRLGKGDLLSIPELAVIAHIPTDEAIPGLQHAGARAVAPPPGTPTPGPGVKPLGVADTGHRRRVGLAVADARQHVHLLGATGSGKSTLMAQLILDDASAGRGVVVVDPKGDLITDVLDRLPIEAAERVTLFDADSKTTAPCLNPLDDGLPDITVDNLVSVFARVYSASWGPRTDDILRAACLTLRAYSAASHSTATLADLPTLLGDPVYRTTATAAVTDPVLRGFWSWYEQLSDAGRAQVIAPLMNKLRAFLLRPFVKHAIAGGPSTVDMAQVLDRGGLCLVRIPKGSLGEETTRLVGSLVVARVWQTATARARLPQPARADCALYMDECQNFLNLPYPLEDMLAEARGFRLSMVLAHQHLGQLGRDLHDGISANARSKVFFNASPEDARELGRHTAPRLTEHDLAHLGAYRAAARLMVAGEQTAPFTLATEPLTAATPGRRRAIQRAAAARVQPPSAEPSRTPVPADERRP